MSNKSGDQRRSAFEEWVQERPERVQGQSALPAPLTPMDLMGPEPKMRNRRWEKEHHTHSYRGVPHEIHDQVIDLAEHLQVSTDEIVQVFVQYGLSCIARGILTISPRPKAQRMTLFPLPKGWGKQTGWSEADGWNPEEQKEIPIKRKCPIKEEKSLWEIRAHYRMSDDIHEAIKQLAEKHTVPVGEIMTLFLKHGLESYKLGHLKLNPQPKIINMTLAESTSRDG
jgi:hypothetical protein